MEVEEYKENNINQIEINIEDINYGWYSHTQKKMVKENISNQNKRKRPISSIYLTPNGDEVEVTMVSKSNNKNDFNFNDIVFKGIVTKWKRAIFN
tara:strand:+ start:80 stop:364 length:285 start_codon:yes stop_codon:yes gene_type:complete